MTGGTDLDAVEGVSFMQYIARIQFGFGAIGKLSEELGQLNVQRPLLVTDPGIVKAGLLDKLRAVLPATIIVSVFAECPREPTESAIEQALESYKAGSCDGIVALGGGAVIDLAKGVALLATHAPPLRQYSAEAGGSALIRRDVAPLVTVPTTAGTGSEIGRGAGIAMGQGGVKSVFLSVNLVARVAICDPDLTMTTPPALTAGAGIDALSHCLEAFLSRAINPPVDAIALDGIARIVRALPVAIETPDHRGARWHAMMGAVQGGMCFWKGLGAAHAMANPLDHYNLHHGLLVGLLLPHAVRFSREADPAKVARLDAIFGQPAEEGLLALNRRIGLTQGLGALGVPRGDLPVIAEEAERSVFNATALRSGTKADYLTMLEAAF